MTTRDQIADRIQAFAAELEVLVRQAAVDAVTAALGGQRVDATKAPSRPRGRPPTRSVTSPAPSPTAPTTTKLAFKRKAGAKRTPEQLAQIDAAVLGYVKSNAGQGIEHIAKALGVPSNDLKLRVALLVDGKKLKKTGVKRATKYFAA